MLQCENIYARGAKISAHFTYFFAMRYGTLVMSKDKKPIIIKKYANRRLYNTDTSSYITLDFLADLVREEKDFTVLDAKTDEDITRQILTQIIFEAENSGPNLLSVEFLRELIGHYSKSTQNFLPSYLEMSVKQFSETQEQWKSAFLENSADPTRIFSGVIKANLDMFSKAAATMSNMAQANPFIPDAIKESSAKSSEDALKNIQDQMKAMQAQLDKMSKS